MESAVYGGSDMNGEDARENEDAETERVDYDEISQKFTKQVIERDGVAAEIEAVSTASDDPRDDDARYTFEVRATYVE